MYKYLLSYLLLFGVITPFLNAQNAPHTPKLVVGITIDQLRGDYLEMMLPVFGNGGFKRLMSQGVVYNAMEINLSNIDRTSAMSAIYTGAYPQYTGMVGNFIYNPKTKRVESALFDGSKMGNYTGETLSPAPLLTSTITDEYEVATDGLAQVFAVAPHPHQAIIAAGHVANGAYWIEDAAGRWATTTYYNIMPQWIEECNTIFPLSQRIDTILWSPKYPISHYSGMPYNGADFIFKHNFARAKEAKYAQFKTSGLINKEVNKVIKSYFDLAQPGTRFFPDFINIGYSATNFMEMSIQDYPLEVQDTYVRLDEALAELFDMIDRKVGMQNAFVFVVSTGYSPNEAKERGMFQLPSGEFYPKRAESLLNMYLMAVYGDGQWVDGYYNGQIWLNAKLIDEKLLSLQEVEQRSAEFLTQMSGVHSVVTSQQLRFGGWNPLSEAMRNGHNTKVSGHLMLEIAPGWEIVHEDALDSRSYVRHSKIKAPLMFLGNGLVPKVVDRPVDVTQIAPTVTKVLRVRTPNACKSLPLAEVK